MTPRYSRQFRTTEHHMSNTQIAKRPALDPAILTTLSEVSANATTAFSAACMSTGNVAAALEVAGAIEDLRQLFDRPDIQSRIVALQDTAIGFRTDRDPKVFNKKLDGGKGGYNQPYPYVVVKDCAIEATLRGLQLVGNQINIISQRCYVTREGFEYLIKRRKEITNFVPIVGIPQMRERGCLVECEASWDNAGTKQGIKVTIPVKADDYGTADQYIGKATRKLLKRCYEIMTGNVLPEGDAEDAEHLQLPAASTAQIEAPARTRATRAERASTAGTLPAGAPVSEATTKPATPPPAQEAEVLPNAGQAKPAAERSVQDRLADLVGSVKGNFDQYMVVATQLQTVLSPGDENATCFDEISEGACQRSLAGHRAIKQCLLAVMKEGAK